MPERVTDSKQLIGYLNDSATRVDTTVITVDIITDRFDDLGAGARACLTAVAPGSTKFFVPGNHDYYNGAIDRLRSTMAQCGYLELSNRAHHLQRDQRRSYFAGWMMNSKESQMAAAWDPAVR